MKIFYNNAEILLSGGLENIMKRDIGNPNQNGSGPNDGILDDFEIMAAGGFDTLEHELFEYDLEIKPRGPLNEYDIRGSIKRKLNKTPKSSDRRKYPGVIVTIPGGEFEMGSNEIDESNIFKCKAVKVKMTGFRLAKTEVTVGQYKVYLREIGDSKYSKLPPYGKNREKDSDNHPVLGLTFTEKKSYAEYYGGKLPTAAQIEYASKGPSHNDPFGTPKDKMIVCNDPTSECGTAEVCGKNDERANGFGVCDLAGNAKETTSDGFDPDFCNNITTTDPSNPFEKSGAEYVEVRGGSFFSFQATTHSTLRNKIDPKSRGLYDGFRVAWPLEP